MIFDTAHRWLTRKNIILIGGGILVVAGLIVGVTFLVQYLSQREVTFTLSSDVQSITITNDDAECSTTCTEQRSGSGKVRLTDGSYSVYPSGNSTVSTDPIEIKVGKNSTAFTITPAYSAEHLAELLSSEATSIRNTLQTKYPNIFNNYSADIGELYQRGEWYTTSLSSLGTESADVYYVILHKVDGQWRIAAGPSLYFSYSIFKDIPQTILYKINSGADL